MAEDPENISFTINVESTKSPVLYRCRIKRNGREVELPHTLTALDVMIAMANWLRSRTV